MSASVNLLYKTVFYQIEANVEQNKITCLLDGILKYFRALKIMSGPTELLGTCRRAVITGVSSKPEWSQLRDKLSFLKYGAITHCETQEQHYVVYAHAHPPLRKAAWMKLFPSAKSVEKVTEFEDCKFYCQLKAKGLLKTLGEPLRKDVVREHHETNAEYSGKNVTGMKRKAGNDRADFTVENKERKEKISKLKEDIRLHKSWLSAKQWGLESATYRPKTQEAMDSVLKNINLCKVKIEEFERELARI